VQPVVAYNLSSSDNIVFYRGDFTSVTQFHTLIQHIHWSMGCTRFSCLLHCGKACICKL